MREQAGTTIHASCVLVGRSAVLIRGPSGSGKSRLAAALIETLSIEPAAVARLVADDRVYLFAANGRLLASAPAAIEGLLEIRGLGIRHTEFEPLALVELVVDLGAPDGARMPEDSARSAELLGVKLSRLPVAAGDEALPTVLAAVNALTRA
jgi:serine kinase of HPr protein (carbohydrate metabolism regulator)